MTDAEVVDALVREHGLSVSADERQFLIAAYAPNRASIEALYAVELQPDAAPQLFFKPAVAGPVDVASNGRVFS